MCNIRQYDEQCKLRILLETSLVQARLCRDLIQVTELDLDLWADVHIWQVLGGRLETDGAGAASRKRSNPTPPCTLSQPRPAPKACPCSTQLSTERTNSDIKKQ